MSFSVDLTQLAGAVVVVIGGFFRQEGKLSGFKRELELLEKRIDAHEGVLKDLTTILGAVKESLARIEVKLED